MSLLPRYVELSTMFARPVNPRRMSTIMEESGVEDQAANVTKNVNFECGVDFLIEGLL